MKELIVDNFAGGGGASTGISMATGRSVDIAINHDPDAIAMHKANHPTTKHYCENVWDVDPKEACGDKPIALAWFSPDCTHFSRAKGGKPVDKNIRGLAWVTLRWAYMVRPRVIMLENVPEIRTWGPLGVNNRPIKERMGETFEGFIQALTSGLPKTHPAFGEMCSTLGIDSNSEMAQALEKGLGYDVEYRILRSCDYGAPTTRTRFYLIARCDGKKIVWPEPTHAPKDSEAVKNGEKLPYRTAAECIDWSIPAKSIFEREKPLAENTLRRIAKGIQKFVVENPEPYIISDDNDGKTANEYGVITPTIMCNNTRNVGASVEAPVPTVTTGNRNYLVAPMLIQYHSEQNDSEVRGQKLSEPIMTVDTNPRYALSCAYIMKNYAGGYTGSGSAADKPLSTISCSGAHHAEVQAFLVKYFSTGTAKSVNEPLDTITTKDRFAVVTIHGEDYIITDIKMRMLQPRELFNAQGFPADYIIDKDDRGNSYPKSKQVARCGNAVTPPVPAALVRANLPEMCERKR